MFKTRAICVYKGEGKLVFKGMSICLKLFKAEKIGSYVPGTFIFNLSCCSFLRVIFVLNNQVIDLMSRVFAMVREIGVQSQVESYQRHKK